MIFAKFAFSIKIRKLLDFAFVFKGQNEENPFKNRIQKRVTVSELKLSRSRRARKKLKMRFPILSRRRGPELIISLPVSHPGWRPEN